MAKNAYLVVTDLHDGYQNKANRIDYRSETLKAKEEIIKVASEFKDKGYKVTFIFLGDIFDRSYKDVFQAAIDNNFFIALKSQFGDIYSVIGNHELTYYKANPFFTLVSTIKSVKLQRIVNKVWMPVGIIPTIHVVDRLEDGNVVFHFNHYSTDINKPENGKINIGLFHQEIVFPKAKEFMEKQLNTSIYGNLSDCNKIDGYQYAFLGHMHSMYGIWKVNDCFVTYLASLGRTSISEINNNFLERRIPVVCVEDGEFSGIETRVFSLPPREECVNEKTVEIAKSVYQHKKDRDILKSYVPSDDSPINNLNALFVDHPMLSRVIDELLKNDVDTYGKQLERDILSMEGL